MHPPRGQILNIWALSSAWCYCSSRQSKRLYKGKTQNLLQKSQTYYPFLKKLASFPLKAEIKGLFQEEWQKVDRKSSPANRLQKLYPLAEEDAPAVNNPPTVDAVIMRLARNVTLPMEDSSSFIVILHRRIDIDLQKSYLAAGGAYKPTIALTSVASAMHAWTQNLVYAIKRQIPEEQIIKALGELKLSAGFVGGGCQQHY